MKIFAKTILLLLAAPYIALSQQISFNNYTVDDGLAQSVVKCIIQDSEGFLWFGTQDGLSKFDGYTFEKFANNPIDTNSISNNWVYSITEDKNGFIWVATRNGLNKFDKRKKVFEKYFSAGRNSNSLFANEIYGIDVTYDNKIVTNTPPVVNLLNPQNSNTERVRFPIESQTGIEDEKLPTIVDIRGNIWAATLNGVVKYNIATKQTDVFGDDYLSCNRVRALFEDKAGDIWIGTQTGLDIYKSDENKFYKVDFSAYSLNQEYIQAITQDYKGNYWIGTRSDGLLRLSFDKNTHTITSFSKFQHIDGNNKSLCHDNVHTLFIDNSNILWIGTLNGISKTDLKDKRFKLYRNSTEANSVPLLDNVIASIYKDRKGKVWVGTWGKGLNIYDRETGEIKYYSSSRHGNNFIPNDFVHFIHEDLSQNIWIGTRDGLLIYDESNGRFISYKTVLGMEDMPSFDNIRIYHIYEAIKGEIWIATNHGLYLLNLKERSYRHFVTDNKDDLSISENLIYSIVGDEGGDVWMGTTNGLNKFSSKDNSIQMLFRNPDSLNTLCDDFIVSLCIDYTGDLWIGTKNGLNRLNLKTGVYDYYNEEQGFPSNMIYEILEDKNKNLWFGTGKGLARYMRESNTFKVYNIEDGLQSLEFNLKARYNSKDGEVFFGGMNGFNSFYPDSLKENAYKPPVAITSFTTTSNDGTKQINIDESKEIHLTHDIYEFVIEFAALEFTNPEQNQYKYFMENLTEDWVNIGTRRFVQFSSLSQGTYRFKVSGSNNDGVWSDKGAEIVIVIHPPWWKTKVAYGAYIIFLIVAVILFIKIRERRLIKEKKVLEDKVQERTRDIALKNEMLNQRNEEIIAQRDEIMAQKEMVIEQRDQIMVQKKAITDSIQYAKRIQSAVMPSDKEFGLHFREYFVFYKPKDIVSGDFFWLKKVGKHVILTAADCTGHGVPGAFVSLLGISFLNELAQKKSITTTAEMLNQLRQYIKASFTKNGNGRAAETRDGMDLAICAINTETNEMQYSGANNPIYLIRNDELLELKADKMPIGLHLNERPFTNNSIQLKKNDCMYLFSDGITDQFGGPSGHKFLRKRFKETLLEMWRAPMNEQKKRLQGIYENWKGAEDQIDDIMVIGLKI